ncbi:MAG TPA: DNA helicase RecQ [Ginsengibacter sp.]|nr:DNA helicase RecQ [Ginsengibacter sp.]HRP43299.1 DNA helicase RecQ [Ginsengibacter sp.]
MPTAKTKSKKTTGKSDKPAEKKLPKRNLAAELHKYFGFNNFKGTQEAVINCLLDGKDTFVIMPTGGGKSLCYQLPAIISEGCALVVSPLIALMKNQVDLVRGYSSTDDIAHFMNSTLNKGQIKEVKDDLLSGKTKLLYVAPETMTKEDNVDFFKDLNISFVAVDEAHCISEWGHDFRPEYRRLRDVINQINENIPVIALTATATPKVQSDIIQNLGLKDPKVFISSFNRPNLYYEVVPKVKKEQTLKSIVKFIAQNRGKSGIIYTLNRKTTEEIADMLNANGIKAAAYHAGLDAKLRSERQDKFLSEKIQVIVATIAFGMGIDKPDIRFVIHYNIPKSIENYYQETGRAGRDGLEGKCILYYSHHDVAKLEHLMRDKTLTEREIGAQLIRETVAYSESAVCRRKLLLNYFGEIYPKDNCGGKCDNCKHPKELIEAKEEALIALKVIESLEERFPANYVIPVILGSANPQIQMYRHDSLAVFGSGKAYDELYWNSLIRQLILANYIKKDIADYGVLKFTDSGKAFMKKPTSFKIAINHTFETGSDDDDDEADNAEGVATDEKLFEMLKELRQREGRKRNLPPFVIFLESSLMDMATLYPTSTKELEKCQGVSAGKAIKFGKPFIELISKYVEENDIEKPEEFVVRSVANKSSNKVFIIQNIDKKLPLETIAKHRSMPLSELLEEMETIVASGTKLNLDYAIDEWMDEYEKDEIIEYFKGCETSSLETAQEELSDSNYSLEQLKIMRIKFLSEYGN